MTIWNTMQENSSFDGFVPVELDKEIDIQWTVKTSSIVDGCALVTTPDLVIVPLANGDTIALNHDGELVWKHTPPKRKGSKRLCWSAPPVVDDDLVYVPRELVFECLDLATGVEKWCIETRPDCHNLTVENYMDASHPTSRKEHFCSYLLTIKERNELLLRDSWGTVVIDRESGRFLHHLYSRFTRMKMPLILAWGNYLVARADRKLLFLDCATFDPVFEIVSPFSLDQLSYTGSSTYLYVLAPCAAMCIDIVNQKIIWVTESERANSVKGTAMDGKYLYYVQNYTLICLDALTGSEQWTKFRMTDHPVSIAVTKDMLLLPAQNKTLDAEYGLFDEMLSEVEIYDKMNGELIKKLAMNCGQQKVLDLNPSLTVVGSKVFLTGKKEIACAW